MRKGFPAVVVASLSNIHFSQSVEVLSRACWMTHDYYRTTSHLSYLFYAPQIELLSFFIFFTFTRLNIWAYFLSTQKMPPTSTTESPPASIAPVPGPWTLRGTVYTIGTYISSKNAALLSENKSFLYDPLELSSSFAAGKAVGGVGMVQVIRYTESPVGPYDELLMVPGFFEREDIATSKNGEKISVKRKSPRCTRIYVSQERTCWNGRKSEFSHILEHDVQLIFISINISIDWNIPKHLADFKFSTLNDGSVSISVYPRIADSSGVESMKSTTAFFSATFKTIPYLPSFPFSTGPLKYLGLDIAMVQPPLPAGKGVYNEVVGTEGEGWCKVQALEWAKNCKLGWFDLRVDGGEEEMLLAGNERRGDSRPEHENWWPGMGRWQIGVVMHDAVIEFPKGDRWLI
jgi:hypothetical protein